MASDLELSQLSDNKTCVGKYPAMYTTTTPENMVATETPSHVVK